MGEAKRRRVAGFTEPKPKHTMSGEERKRIITQTASVVMSDVMSMYKQMIKVR